MANDCASCQYTWSETSECRRFPPTAMMIGAELRSVWPIVTDSDWCGEFKALPPAPGALTLTSLNPNTLVHGTTPTTIDAYGTAFDSSCSIYVDGTARATFFIDDTHLQYTARPDLVTTPGTAQVTVVGTGGTSNALTFTYT